MKLQLSLIASTVLLAGTAQSATIIHAGKLITADSDKVLTEHTVVVEQDKIIAVESGYKTPAAGDQVIDLKNHTVMPGLMDMHTHFSTQMSPATYTEEFLLNEADVALRGATFAEKNADGRFYYSA